MKISSNERPYALLLIVSATMLLGHQFLQRILQVNIPFLDNYFDPFWSIPFLLSGFVLERRYLLQLRDFRLSLLEISVTTIAFGFLFEYVFPYFFPGFFFDAYDFVAYFAGMILFYVFTTRHL
jgi:hypothetical protein